MLVSSEDDMSNRPLFGVESRKVNFLNKFYRIDGIFLKFFKDKIVNLAVGLVTTLIVLVSKL